MNEVRKRGEKKVCLSACEALFRQKKNSMRHEVRCWDERGGRKTESSEVSYFVLRAPCSSCPKAQGGSWGHTMKWGETKKKYSWLLLSLSHHIYFCPKFSLGISCFWPLYFFPLLVVLLCLLLLRCDIYKSLPLNPLSFYRSELPHSDFPAVLSVNVSQRYTSAVCLHFPA